MVTKIEKWQVGDVTFDDEEDAILYESRLALLNLLRKTEILDPEYCLFLLEARKDIWEAMTAYCEALEHVHNPPKTFERIFNVDEASNAFPYEELSQSHFLAQSLQSIGDETP